MVLPVPRLARLALTIAALLLVAGCTSADDDVAPDNAGDAAAATSTAAATEELATIMAGVLGPEADVSGAVGAIVPFPPVLTPPLADVVGFSASVDGPVDGPADEGGGTRAVTSVSYDVEVGAGELEPYLVDPLAADGWEAEDVDADGYGGPTDGYYAVYHRDGPDGGTERLVIDALPFDETLTAVDLIYERSGAAGDPWTLHTGALSSVPLPVDGVLLAATTSVAVEPASDAASGSGVDGRVFRQFAEYRHTGTVDDVLAALQTAIGPDVALAPTVEAGRTTVIVDDHAGYRRLRYELWDIGSDADGTGVGLSLTADRAA